MIARLLNETGRQVSCGKLELTYSELIYRFSQRNLAKTERWPLAGLRGYGFYDHLFSFEAGRRCSLPGIFIFKCKQARLLHSLLSKHVNSLAQMGPDCRAPWTYRSHSDQGKMKFGVLPSGSPASAPPLPETSVNSDEIRVCYPSSLSPENDVDRNHQQPYRRHALTPPPPHHHCNPQCRWRLSDDYIYLSRTLTPSPPLTNLPSPQPSAPSSTGGVYLVAIPGLSSAHSYENQRSLITASSCS
ncbi:unnamed protein product [Mesocestoides corti]|nr:unnamed protein product [Mesocestoides corti]